MKQEKRKRLETAGWKIGDTQAFLGLSDDEAAIIELKLDLAKAVKAERIRRKLTQDELGKLLGSSQSRVAKMEVGDPSVSIDLLVRSLLRMGATREDLARHLSTSPRKRGYWRAIHTSFRRSRDSQYRGTSQVTAQ